MTPTQLRVLDFVRDHIDRLGFSPTIREIVAGLNGNISSVHQAVDLLVRDCYLARSVNAHRGIRLVDMPNLRAVSSDALSAELARRGVTMASLMPGEPRAFGKAVSCAADTCGAEVKPGMLMCRTHWFALSRDLQDRIRRTFACRDVAGYQAAVAEARDLIDSGAWRRQA